MANSKEFGWKDLSVVILGKTITGIQNVEYKSATEKDYVYGRGSEPLSIQSGNKSYEGSMELLRSEFDLLLIAAKAANPLYSIADIAFDVIVCYENPTIANKVITDVLMGCEFTEEAHKIGQGDKFAKVTLPFKYLRQVTK